MSEERSKNQEQLAFPFAWGGEAPAGDREGAEAPRVRREAEDPAGNQRVMEEVCERENRRAALKRVRANQGSPGIDGMTVEELPGYLEQHRSEEHTSELQSPCNLVCRLLLEKKTTPIRRTGTPTSSRSTGTSGGTTGRFPTSPPGWTRPMPTTPGFFLELGHPRRSPAFPSTRRFR